MTTITITIRIDTPEGSSVSVDSTAGTAPAPGARNDPPPRTAASAPPSTGGSASPSGDGRADGSASDKQKKMIYAKAKQGGLTKDELVRLLQHVAGVQHTNDLGFRDIDPMVKALAQAEGGDIPF
jgi:hypothetical protein